ncbi:hypothetical protein VNO77_22842 [Canavalia gladiata]|uniref:Uncharacterized protein n=1 Tax=Canavalia gladiata TaxID=3824 RepID=A0AAN9L3D1_CANGL
MIATIMRASSKETGLLNPLGRQIELVVVAGTAIRDCVRELKWMLVKWMCLRGAKSPGREEYEAWILVLLDVSNEDASPSPSTWERMFVPREREKRIPFSASGGRIMGAYENEFLLFALSKRDKEFYGRREGLVKILQEREWDALNFWGGVRQRGLQKFRLALLSVKKGESSSTRQRSSGDPFSIRNGETKSISISHLKIRGGHKSKFPIEVGGESPKDLPCSNRRSILFSVISLGQSIDWCPWNSSDLGPMFLSNDPSTNQLQNASLTEQQQAAIISLSHVVSEQPLPLKLARENAPDNFFDDIGALRPSLSMPISSTNGSRILNLPRKVR